MNDDIFPHAIIEIDNPEMISLFKKIVIPSSLGDETQTPPYPGKYANVLMVYEANGHSYLYSSDGIPTALGFDTGGILVVDAFPELEQAATNFLYIKRDTGEAQITTDNQNWTIIAGHYGAVYAVDAQPDAADAEPDSLYVDYTTGEAWLTHDNATWITVNETGGKVLLVDAFPDVANARLDTLYISSADQEARITGDNIHWVTISGGGGGGTTDFDQLTNRPKYAGQVMTSATDIPDFASQISSLSSSLSQETQARIDGDSTLQQEFNAIIQTLQDDVDALELQIANKVDKVTGKGLSTNDFTNAYKALVDSAIQPSDLNYTVMTDLSLPTNPSTTSVVLTADKVNLGTGVTSDKEISLPVASTTQAGIINKATYDTIQDNAEKIEAILGGAVAVNNIPATPTQAQLTTAWQTATGQTTLINGASILDTANSLKWTYYTNDTTWHSASVSGAVSINNFTNTEAGLIKGSTTVGQVFAETNGTGSVNGWDALTARVTTAESTLTTKVDKVTGKGLSTNDFTDALKTKLDGIEAGAQVNSPLYSTTGSNTNGAMTQAATTNALAQKLSHGNLTTGIGLEKSVTGSGTNTNVKIEVDETVVMHTDLSTPSSTAFVNTANIVDGAVTTDKIATSQVTDSKIDWPSTRTQAVVISSHTENGIGDVYMTFDAGMVKIGFWKAKDWGQSVTIPPLENLKICDLPATVKQFSPIGRAPLVTANPDIPNRLMFTVRNNTREISLERINGSLSSEVVISGDTELISYIVI